MDKWPIVAAFGLLLLLIVGVVLWFSGALGVGPSEKRGDPPLVKTAADQKAATRPLLLDCAGDKGASAADVRNAQEAWAKYLGRQMEEEDEIARGVKMKFVLVPPGKFLMGSPEGEADRGQNEGQHEVELTQPFYLGVYDVTQAQYEAVTGKNPSQYKGEPDLPVEWVSWDDGGRLCERVDGKSAGWTAVPLADGGGVGILLSRRASFFPSFRDRRRRLPLLARRQLQRRLPVRRGGQGSIPERRPRWAPIRRMPWACTTCRATYGSGAPTGTATTRRAGRSTRRGRPRASSPGVPGRRRGRRGRDCRAAARGGFIAGNRSYFLGFRLARVPSGLDK